MTGAESIKPLWSTTGQVAVFLSDISDGQPLRIGERCSFILDGPIVPASSLPATLSGWADKTGILWPLVPDDPY